MLFRNLQKGYLNHLINGGELPKNECEIASTSLGFLFHDLETERKPEFKVDPSVLTKLDDILSYLAYSRSLGETSGTAEIFCRYISLNILKGNGPKAKEEADMLLRYLRSRAIIVGNDGSGNVYHGIFRAYLSAKEIYKQTYALEPGPMGNRIVFSTFEDDGETFSGKDFLSKCKEESFVSDADIWPDAEAFFVAQLDEVIAAVHGVKRGKELAESGRSYATLRETLELLYSTEADKARQAYRLLGKMIDARSLYNVDAFRKILGL